MAALNSISAVLPQPSQAQLDKGYGLTSIPRTYVAPNSATTDFATTPGHPIEKSVLSQQPNNYSKFHEEWDASQRGSSIIDGYSMQRSTSVMSQGDTLIPSRGGTLKKKASLKRQGSLKRSSSRRSSRAGSVRSLVLQPGGDIDEMHSAFYSPVPTSGNPTEILANRFQAWRKVLKDLIAYFREIQASYDHRAKNLLKVTNVINNTNAPVNFLRSGGIDDAAQILRQYHKTSIAEANKSKDIENDVILALVGLRSDLNQKIKEIKNLSGDFKNSVEKEMDATRRAVNELQEGLGQSDIDTASTTGKKDPYLLKLAVDRQVEKQIDEENYLHQAYLNLEASGRELEAIVVGEIQKSYNALAGILKREADAAMVAVDELRSGPIAMPKDHEWEGFVQNDDHFVDPSISIREAQNIQYPGRDNELAQEVRAGLLERKSKYLKSYTAGWYEDIKTLTEKSPQERSAFVRQHARSVSGTSQKAGSISSDGIMDEEDDEPFSAANSAAVAQGAVLDGPRRPVAGGRFPSDIKVEQLSQRGLQAPLSPSSGSSGYGDVQDGNLGAVRVGQNYVDQPDSPTHAQLVNQQAHEDGINPYTYQRYGSHGGDHVPPAAIAAAGLAGAGLGAAGVGAHRRRSIEDENAANLAEYNRRLEQQAALEAQNIAALDTHIYTDHQQQAAREALVISTSNSTTTYNQGPYHMSGGRSQSDLTSANAEHNLNPPISNPIESALAPLIDDVQGGRPTLAAGQNHQSVSSISQLHVPGEFPRTSPNTETKESLGANKLPI